MPLPGGPSDKFGNRYERWWTVYQLVRIIDGQAESIRIEDPTVDKTEFVITAGDHQEFHQARRSHLSGKWSLCSLGHESLLLAMFDQLSRNPGARFVFVSGSDVPELRELTERAVSAKNLEEFEKVFVSAQSQKANLEKLRSFWNDANTAMVYEILQRIEVRTIDEQGIEDQVQGFLPALFLNSPDEVCNALRSFTEDSIHKFIDREKLISHLQTKGFTLRKLSKPNDAPALISEATNRYLEFTRRRLIQGSLISRSSTQELLAKTRQNNCVLTGKAGGGKTGCVIECIEALHRSSEPVAVLAFRLDSLGPVSSTKELGECLGLEESPALVLATAAEATSSDAVLIIDQLDAVSTTSGRSSNFFDVVEDLLKEARGLRNKVKFHVLVVCREFDWENDHRLRRLLTKDDTKISVTDFSLDEVKASLDTSGFNAELFDARQLELLRLPQNLALFLDTNCDPGSQPTFFSPKDLFDRYWKVKREAVNARVASSDSWHRIIRMLCDEMTVSQQLSVSKEKLDQFSNDYLDQMASEGVLSFDGHRYGFGHETFFDYCFARAFMSKDESLTAFLVTSEQHLFRRAQVRQVLVYLRDADQERYCRELSGLLTNERIRYHLKDLAVALAVSMPSPEENEWDVLAPWIESELEAIKSGKPNPEKFASLVWNRFFFSQPWFQITDSKRVITDWLASESASLVNTGVNYIRSHQRHSGDRTAELLEPFVGKGGEWPQRLSYVMQWAALENSRKFFDLFLRLIDDGTLDDARGPITANSTFWSMLYGLAKERPDWIPEVTSHWLLRRLSILRKSKNETSKPNWNNFFNNDGFGPEHIQDSATQAPEEFAQHVLSVILKIADEAVYDENKPAPKYDAVWGILFDSEHPSIGQACRNAITVAVEKLAEIRSDSIDEILTELRSRDTYMANFLLLRAYTAGAKHFADDAVSDLCDQAWRFGCGYSDSPYWIAIELIKAVTPLCSQENRAKLERAILDYTPDYERTADGYRFRGHACFGLLSGIPPELRSQHTQARYEELERKFGEPESPPKKIEAHWVGSPIEKPAAEKMTDEQWLKAIKEYDSEQSKHFWKNPQKGGAWQLAGMLQEFVQKEPRRFAQLSLRFPADINPVYMERTLKGLKETNGLTELKLDVCRKAYSESPDDCGQALADVLGSIEELLPDDVVQMLDWLATEHPEPERELWNEEITGGTPYYRGDAFEHGINTTRGRAAEAIRDLILRDSSYIERFRSTIERLVNDNSVSVRACASSTLLATINHDSDFALGQFLRLVEPRTDPTSDDRLLTTPYVERFINYGLYDHFGHLWPVVEQMLRSSLPEVNEAGARLASIALLLHNDNAEILVEEAFHGNSSHRLGVAQVASANIGKAEHRQWSEQKLLLFFDDTDNKVRQEAAECFRSLEKHPLQSYENLINRFCDSAAYQENSFPILLVLEKSSHHLPGITYVVCQKFLERFSDEARDIRTSRAANVPSVIKLILRTYHQHQHDEWASKCLDLIDGMCLEMVYDIKNNLDEYER